MTVLTQQLRYYNAVRVRAIPLAYVLLASCVSIGAFMRFWQIGTRPGWDWDEPVYANIAGNVAAHGTIILKPNYGMTPVPWLYHPPFHFLFVGAWFREVGSGVTQERVWGAGMALIALTLLFFALRAMLGSNRALLVSGLLLIDTWMVYANRVSSIENTLMVLIVLSIWMYGRASYNPTKTRYIVAGVFVGATVCYKFTGAYIVLAVLINWLITRQKKTNRLHLMMLGATASVVVLYFGVMTIISWGNGDNSFWQDNAVQLQRTIGLHGNRGSLDGAMAMISPLFHQYRVFIGTILVAGASALLVIWRLIQCFKLRSWQPVRQHSLLFAWALASIIAFGSIGLKFPTYFQLLLVPLYVYLVAELSEKFVKVETAPRLRVLLSSALVVLVALSMLGFKWRIVDHDDNAMKSTQQYAELHIPRDAIVLAEESVGTIIPQQYCNIYNAWSCGKVASYIITYSSQQHPVPDNSAFRQLLARSKEVTSFTGFKETITVRKIIP